MNRNSPMSRFEHSMPYPTTMTSEAGSGKLGSRVRWFLNVLFCTASAERLETSRREVEQTRDRFCLNRGGFSPD